MLAFSEAINCVLVVEHVPGDDLAEAYANIDIFLFPSETDAFGNVTQEAHASGVPAIVSDKGGPKFIVREGETGFVAKTPEDYVTYASMLYDNPDKLAEMKRLSRESAMSSSWDSIFEGVYDGYREAISLHKGSSKPEANA